MSDHTILCREAKIGQLSWRQYLVITDNRVAIVHMVPTQWEGWRFDRVTIQGESDWSGMTRETIVSWKLDHDDGLTRIVDSLDSVFRSRLLNRAGVTGKDIGR